MDNTNTLKKLLDENQLNFSQLFDELKIIKIKIITIENELDIIRHNTNNINTHISFVENVYESIKYPFYFIMNNFSNKKITPLVQIKTIEN